MGTLRDKNKARLRAMYRSVFNEAADIDTGAGHGRAIILDEGDEPILGTEHSNRAADNLGNGCRWRRWKRGA